MQQLDGMWSFAFLGDVDVEAIDATAITFDDLMAVPGCFDAMPRYAGKRGVAAYRTTVTLHACSRRLLQLGAVHHWGKIFFNGAAVGTCQGGFMRHDFELDPTAEGDGELIVLVDNRIDPNRSPLHHDYFDWYHYGGLSRSAALIELPKAAVNDVRIETTAIDPPTVRIEVNVDAEKSDELPLQIQINGETVLDEQVRIERGSNRIARQLQLQGLGLWSSQTPTLHEARISLAGDEVTQKFGIRTVAVEGEHLTVNGQAVRLLGVNRHESSVQLGHTQSASLMLADLQRIAALGCNFIRVSHYPPDPAFLELCDQLGIYVWAETTAWQQDRSQLHDSAYMAAQLDCAKRLAAVCYNHPSVIILAALNEVSSDDEACREPIGRTLEQLRVADRTRLVAFACNHPSDCLALPMADLIALNIYPGWYGSEIEQIPEELDKAIADARRQAGKDCPLIISEIGAGAIPGWRDAHGGRWTEQYQTRLLDTVIRHLFAARADCTGLAIWQFCDIRTSELPTMQIARPRGYNNKGLLDEFRRPKEAYHLVARWYRQLRDDHATWQTDASASAATAAN